MRVFLIGQRSPASGNNLQRHPGTAWLLRETELSTMAAGLDVYGREVGRGLYSLPRCLTSILQVSGAPPWLHTEINWGAFRTLIPGLHPRSINQNVWYWHPGLGVFRTLQCFSLQLVWEPVLSENQQKFWAREFLDWLCLLAYLWWQLGRCSFREREAENGKNECISGLVGDKADVKQFWN